MTGDQENGASELKAVLEIRAQKLDKDLRALNAKIHANPELAFKEHIAHDTICDFLEIHGFAVTRHAYGLQTSFESKVGKGGRLVNFNAEYDALPSGHACGHNLIAIASITAFTTLSHALEKFKIPGRLQLLGTPAEESGAGKALLIKNGAFDGVDASLMCHSFAKRADIEFDGFANLLCSATQKIHITFNGKAAHSGVNPWNGVNAMDAFVLLYNNASLLRQQIQPDERLHGILVDSPKVVNIVPDLTKSTWCVRSDTLNSLKTLVQRLRNCAQAAAIATGCTIDISEDEPYADMVVSKALSEAYIANAKKFGLDIGFEAKIPAGTDQGNVSYVVPSIHSLFPLPNAKADIHHPGYVEAAGSDLAHDLAVRTGQLLALTALDLLQNDELYNNSYSDWSKDRQKHL